MNSEEKLSLIYVLEHEFPHPVSVPFRCSQTSVQPSEKLFLLFTTLESLVRYTSSLLLAEFIGQQPSSGALEKLEPLLRYPTIVRWVELIDQLTQSLKERDILLSELVMQLAGSDEKPGMLQELSVLARKVQNFLTDEEFTLQPDAVETLLVEFEDKLLETAGELSALREYPLVVFEPQGKQDQGFQGTMVRWMGYRRPPLPISVQFHAPVVTHRCLCVAPDLSRAVELDPLCFLHTDSRTDENSLFLFAGLRDSGVLRLDSFARNQFLYRKADSPDLEPVLKGKQANLGLSVKLSPTELSRDRMRFRSRLLPSERLLEGRFKTLGFIGRGGIGAVYEVIDIETGKQLALKVLYPDLARNMFFTRFFLETGTALSRLNHPNIVRVFEAGYSSSLQENHIIMEYLHGGSLAEALEAKEVLPPLEAIGIAIAILDALSFLHKNRLIHGAVHPGNILFDDKGRPKLADFGMLKLTSKKVATFRPLERIHSVRYTAPEILLGAQIGPVCDLYSLALVLYQSLTGVLPDKTRYVPPSELIFPLPKGLDETLRRALALEPAQRYPNAERFKEQLTKVLEGAGEEFQISPAAGAQKVANRLFDLQHGLLEETEREENRLAQQGDWERVASLIEQKLDSLWSIDERVFWMVKLANIFFAKLNSPGKAVALYRECLDLAPENRDAARALIKHYEDTQQFEELAELLEELVQVASPDANLKKEYLQLLVTVADERLKNSARAGQYLEELVKLVGPTEQTIHRLVELKEKAQDWEGAFHALEQWLPYAEGDKQQLLSIYRQMATIAEEKLGSVEYAIELWKKTLTLSPADVEALKHLRKLYTENFSYASLAQILERLRSSAQLDQEELIDIYQQLGELYSSYLYDSAKAVQVWQELLDIDQSNYTALSYLERLYLREGQHDKYLETLEKKANIVDDPTEKASILHTAATALLELYADSDKARPLLEEALRLAPGHKGVEAALERLYDEFGDANAQIELLLSRLDREQEKNARVETLKRLLVLFEEKKNDPESAFQVAQKLFVETNSLDALDELERLAQKTGAFEETVTFLLENLKTVPEHVKEQVTSKAANILAGKMKLTPRIFQALYETWQLQPHNEVLTARLISLCKEAEQWDKLGDILLHKCLKAMDLREQDALAEELVALCRVKLLGTKKAVQLMQKLADGRPDDPKITEALAEAYESVGQIDNAAGTLERRLEVETDPLNAQRLRLKLVDIYQKGGENIKAIAWLEAAFQQDPANVQIIEKLEALLGQEEQWKELTDLYRKLLVFVDDKKAKASYLFKLAEIEYKVFDRHEEAAALYRQLLALEPENEEAALSLCDLLEKTKQWSDLAWTLKHLSQKQKGERKEKTLYQLARVLAQQLDDPEGSIACYRRIIKLNPSDKNALDLMESVAEENARFDLLLRAYDDILPHLPDKDKAEVLTRMAEISLEELHVSQPAKSYIEKAMTLAPITDRALELYRKACHQTQDWNAYSKALESRYHDARTEEERLVAGIELGKTYYENLDRPVQAAQILEEVCEIDPENAQAGLLLARIYVDNAQWDKAAPLLIVLNSSSRVKQESPQILGELAYLSARTSEALLQRDNAIRYYMDAIEHNYKIAEAKARAGKLLYMEDKLEEARELCEPLLEDMNLPLPLRNEVRTLLADIDSKLGRKEESREYLEELVKQDPSNEKVLKKLMDICVQQNDLDAAIRYGQQTLNVVLDSDTRFAILVRLGELLGQNQDNKLEAAAAYEQALEIKPEAKAIAIAAAHAYAEAGEYEKALRLFSKAEELEQEPQKKAKLALTQAYIARDSLRDAQLAARLFKQVLEYTPENLKAFSDLEKLAVELQDWELQREAYEFVLSKLPDTTDKTILAQMHKNLASILLEHKGDPEAALGQMEQAALLDPEDKDLQMKLVAAYLQNPAKHDRALQAAQVLVNAEPTNAEYVRALLSVYRRMKRFDQAWCATAVLMMLKAATPKEEAFYKKFDVSALRIRPAKYTREVWRDNIAPDELDWEFSEVVKLLYDLLAPRLGLKTPKELGYTKKTLLTREHNPVLNKVLQLVIGLYEIPYPDVHVRDDAQGIYKEGTHPPVLVVGRDVLRNRKGKQLGFLCAKALALFIPEYLPAGVIGKDVLRMAIMSALSLLFRGEDAQSQKHGSMYEELMRLLPPRGAQAGALRSLFTSMRRKGAELNLSTWLQAVEKTSFRAGLTLGDDIFYAAQQARTEQRSLVPGKDNAKEIIKDLIRYALSDKYARMRRMLNKNIV